MILVFITIWSYQTFYTNRFSMNNTRDIVFLMFNIFITIYLANSIDTHFDKTYKSFFLCTSILFLSIGSQYFLTFLENIIQKEKKVCLFFGIISFFSSILIFIRYCILGNIYYNIPECRQSLRLCRHSDTIFKKVFYPSSRKNRLCIRIKNNL